MAKTRFKMARIPVPDWAPTYARGEIEFEMVANKYGDAITSAEREGLIARHDDIIKLVDSLVEAYANDGCCPPGPACAAWFPEQAILTGEFYIGEESYHRLLGETWIQIRVEARCVGHNPWGLGDYLGLDVWLRYDPKSGRLRNHRNTDSKVI